jgi:hypothetical protein
MKQTTINQRICDALAVDLLTEEQLRAKIADRDPGSVHNCLVYLLQVKAIGFLADGVTTLYFATPDTDQRIFTHAEAEIPKAPRRRRRKAAKS